MHIMFAIMFNTSNKVLHELNWAIAKFLSEDGKIKTKKVTLDISLSIYGEFC